MKKSISISAVLAVIMAVVMMVTVTACKSYRFETVSEYAQSSEIQEEVKNQSNSDIKCEVYGEGNTLIYKYTYQMDIEDSQISSLASELKNGMSDLEDTVSEVLDELKALVNVEKPAVKVVFFTKEGKQIFESTRSVT